MKLILVGIAIVILAPIQFGKPSEAANCGEECSHPQPVTKIQGSTPDSKTIIINPPVPKAGPRSVGGDLMILQIHTNSEDCPDNSVCASRDRH